VPFPASLDQVSAIVDDGPPGLALVTLPWRSYRNFSWGTGYPSSDPLVRMVDRPVITSDDLAVGDRVVRGESTTDARVGAALARGRPAGVLPSLGVGWVVVYADDPAAGDVDVTGLRRVVATPDLTLYAVPGAVAAPATDAWRRVLVIGADVLALLVVVGAVVELGRPMRRARGGAGPVLESGHPAEKEQ